MCSRLLGKKPAHKHVRVTMLQVETWFYLLQQVGLLYGLQHILLGGLLGFSTQQELIQNKIGFLKVEDNIQLAHLWNAIKVNISL